jgi:tetratricopeptide (TPR) repeat protein
VSARPHRPTRRLLDRVRTLALTAAAVALLPHPLPAQDLASAERAGWLVVPFEVTDPTARTYWLGEGAAALVDGGLARLGLRLLPREARVRALEELRLPTTVSLTRATYIRVAELLGAGVAVFGRVSTDERELTLVVRRLELATGQLSPEIVERGQLLELSSICERAARRLHPAGRPAAATAAAVTPPLEAFETYVKALLAARPDVRTRLLEAALERAPSLDPARLALWEALTDLDEHAEALAAAEAVPAASPLAREARFAAAQSLMALARYDEAFTLLTRLAEARPEAAVFNNLGVIQMRRDWTPHTGRPTYFFNKAAELEPDDADLCFNLGYAYWVDRDSRGAIYWLREAVRRDPADADAHMVLAAALEAAGGSGEAARERALAQQLSARFGGSAARGGEAVPRGLERLRPTLSSWHPVRFDAALRAAAQANQLDLVQFHLDRARRFADEHRDGDAEPELRRVLFLSPYHPVANLLVGRLYLRSGRVAEAVAAFRIALWSEETAEAHAALAEALIESQDLAGARAAVRNALELDPEHAAARALLSRLDAGEIK